MNLCATLRFFFLVPSWFLVRTRYKTFMFSWTGTATVVWMLQENKILVFFNMHLSLQTLFFSAAAAAAGGPLHTGTEQQANTSWASRSMNRTAIANVLFWSPAKTDYFISKPSLPTFETPELLCIEAMISFQLVHQVEETIWTLTLEHHKKPWKTLQILSVTKQQKLRQDWIQVRYAKLS